MMFSKKGLHIWAGFVFTTALVFMPRIQSAFGST